MLQCNRVEDILLMFLGIWKDSLKYHSPPTLSIISRGNAESITPRDNAESITPRGNADSITPRGNAESRKWLTPQAT